MRPKNIFTLEHIRKMGTQQPVGELKKLVSLVDRTGFDEFVYPANSKFTKFQPDFKPYHNFTEETITLPFSGSPAWGQRITFTMPWPWQGDFLNSITLRLKPMSWYNAEQLRRIGNEQCDWLPIEQDSFWIWANSLGQIAIANAEMEVNGVIVEQFSGDWIHVWNTAYNNSSTGTAYDQAFGSNPKPSFMNMHASEDGYVYTTLPFWFSKYANAAYPMLSCSQFSTLRFHITLRPFKEVIRKLRSPLVCDELPMGKSFDIRDYNYPFRKITTLTMNSSIPGFAAADILCRVTHIDGDLRKAYLESPHELLMNPVSETVFSEPMKYAVNTSAKDTVKIGLPITSANGPIKQILFFLRRKAIAKHNDWNNYSATLVNEEDPVWNPERPLLKHAQLMVGTAVWADEDERWWRAVPNLAMPGGIRGYGKYIYGYNFAEKPASFDPSGSLNASRADIRLNLTVSQPSDPSADNEWTVSVFCIGTNWMRFENGLANILFSD